MTNIFQTDRGTYDLDTETGCYEYVAEFLITQGASSRVLSALARLRAGAPKPSIQTESHRVRALRVNAYAEETPKPEPSRSDEEEARLWAFERAEDARRRAGGLLDGKLLFYLYNRHIDGFLAGLKRGREKERERERGIMEGEFALMSFVQNEITKGVKAERERCVAIVKNCFGGPHSETNGTAEIAIEYILNPED